MFRSRHSYKPPSLKNETFISTYSHFPTLLSCLAVCLGTDIMKWKPQDNAK